MTETWRGVAHVIPAEPASDGAGVKLNRTIATAALPQLDPFLLLDEFNTENPGDYVAGFPDHPHRGFETVTYMIEGRMRHQDNAGNGGTLTSGRRPVDDGRPRHRPFRDARTGRRQDAGLPALGEPAGQA